MDNKLTTEDWDALTNELKRWANCGVYERWVLRYELENSRLPMQLQRHARVRSVNFNIDKIVYITVLILLETKDFENLQGEDNEKIKTCLSVKQRIEGIAMYDRRCDLLNLRCSRDIGCQGMKYQDMRLQKLCEKYLYSLLESELRGIDAFIYLVNKYNLKAIRCRSIWIE